MEQRIDELEQKMAEASQAQDLTRLHKLTAEHTALHTRLEQTMDEWATLAAAV
jgi:uncharacterized coiled-coil protein SlyX